MGQSQAKEVSYTNGTNYTLSRKGTHQENLREIEEYEIIRSTEKKIEKAESNGKQRDFSGNRKIPLYLQKSKLHS